MILTRSILPNAAGNAPTVPTAAIRLARASRALASFNAGAFAGAVALLNRLSIQDRTPRLYAAAGA